MPAKCNGREACRQATAESYSPGKGLELGLLEVLSMSLESQTPRTGIQADDLTFKGIDLKASPSSAISKSSDVVDEGLNRVPQIDIAQVTDHQITMIYG